MELPSKPEQAYEFGNLNQQRTVLQRIWKYKLHYIIVIPAILCIILLKIIPFMQGLRISMVEYTPFLGLAESPWVGLDNYVELFRNINLWRVLSNTLIIKISYVLISAVIAFAVALALSGIQSRKLKGAATTLLLIPYFIPSLVIGGMLMLLLSPSSSPILSTELFVMADPFLFRMMLILAEVFKTCGIPIIIALAAIASKYAAEQPDDGQRLAAPRSLSYTRMNVIPALRAVAAVTILQCSAILTTDFELLYTLLNPLVYETADTLEAYTFRLGLMQMNVSPAVAAGMIQFAIQFLFTLAAYFIVRGAFLRDLFSSRPSTASLVSVHRQERSYLGGIVAVVCSAFVLLALYFIFVYPFITASNTEYSLTQLLPAGNYILYICLYAAVVVVNLLFMLTLAYPLTVKDLPGRQLYRLFLLFVLVIGTGLLSEYMYFHKLGMINTVFPLLFTGFINIIGVFVLKSIFNSKYGQLKEQASAEGKGELHIFFILFIPKIWKPLLALGMLQWIALWNSYIPALMYLNNPELYPPIMQVLNASRMANASGMTPGDPIFLQLGAIVSLPSVILFLIFRRWFTAELFVSQVRRK